jgi:uncharacterized phage-associated protein
LANHIPDLSKTKLLKLLYLIEESSAVKYHTPFFGIRFEVWQAGPVAKDVFLDLSEKAVLLKDFVETVQAKNGGTYVKPVSGFNDDEFSDHDIDVLDSIVHSYGKKTAEELVKLTHKESSLWYKAAKKNNLLESFRNGETNHSSVEIDFTNLLPGCAAEAYLENRELYQSMEAFKE